MARLKSIIKNINRRTKWVKMIKIGFNGSAGEARERRMVIGIRKFAATMFGTRSEASRESIAEVGVVFQSRRPEGGINSSRPTVCSMEQGSTGALSEVTKHSSRLCHFDDGHSHRKKKEFDGHDG